MSRILYPVSSLGFQTHPCTNLNSYLERTDGPTTFAHHAAAARLAHKYDALAVLDRVTVRLRTAFFPATFDLWAKHEQARADCQTMSPEYALEAVKQGSAAVGLRSKTHAVLLALKVLIAPIPCSRDAQLAL